MSIILSQKIRDKLADKNHRVTERDICECFANKTRGFIEDDREEHRTDPATMWFVSENNYGRRIKVMFVIRDSDIYIKSAYPATEAVARMYAKKSEEL
jgi:hypothetical protein